MRQLQDELRETEQQSLEIILQFEANKNLMKQKCESMEAFLKESKETTESMRQIHQTTLDQQKMPTSTKNESFLLRRLINLMSRHLQKRRH